MHLNVNGLNNKTSFLDTYLLDHPADVLCITEHHLHRDQINKVNLNNYKLASSHCRTICKRGGVAIFCKHNVPFKLIDISTFTSDIDFEATAIHLVEQNILIVSVYRSPAGDFTIFINKLKLILDYLYKPSLNIVLCGDFNVNLAVQRSDANYHCIQKKKNSLLDLLSSYNLKQTIFDYTRVFGESKSIIDNIFTSLNNIITGYNSETGLSDHFAQYLEINTKVTKSTTNLILKSDEFSLIKLCLSSYLL